MPKKNRSQQGKIHKLPTELRQDVESKLLEGFTYKQISDHLKMLGHDVHLSSVQRFGKPFLQRFEAVKMAKEYAQLLVEDNAERPTTELHEANNALVSQIIMEVLVDEDMKSEEKMQAAAAIATLQRAQIQNERLKITSRKEIGVVRVAMDMMKERLFKEMMNKYPDEVASFIKIADEIVEEMDIN